MPAYSLEELAEALGAQLELPPRDEPGRLLRGVRDLREAGPDELCFVANRRYRRYLSGTRAGAVLLDPETPAPPGIAVLRCADPYLAFARAMALFHPPRPARPGVHPRAVVEEGAVVEGAEIRALAYVGPGAVVGPGTVVEPGAYVGAGARVGRDARIMANAVVHDGCVVGDRVVLNPGAVVGAEGFGFAPTPRGHVKIPQAGRARLEDDVELGANSCVDRAALGETVVRRGAKLDNLVQVGHAAEVGEHDLLVAFSGVAGSSRLGRFVTLAAKAGVLGHLEVGDRSTVAARGLVTRDLPPGSVVAGNPAIDHRRWKRAVLALRELPELLRAFRRLEARLEELERRLGGE